VRRDQSCDFLDPGQDHAARTFAFARCRIGSGRRRRGHEPGDPVVNVTRENVRRNVETLKTAGPIISAAVDSGQVKVVGGIYRLATGQVELVG
jgi:hypothetical protein